MKFKYFVELKGGYQETGFLTENTELEFVIEAKNRVTADRMVRAMLIGCENVKDYIGVCIDTDCK